MTNTERTTPTTTTPTATPAMPDPRPGLTVAAEAVRALVAEVRTEDFATPTPCDEFDVQALLDHIGLVVRRSAAIGRGEHWASIQEDVIGHTIEDYTSAMTTGVEAQATAWSDPSRLDAIVEVPWGAMPGGAVAAIYTAELSTHGWDLATALGRVFTIPDEALEIAWAAVQFIPADGREDPNVPFGPVVDPGPDASLLLRIAGWAGRRVL